jgi:hypothetical protein
MFRHHERGVSQRPFGHAERQQGGGSRSSRVGASGRRFRAAARRIQRGISLAGRILAGRDLAEQSRFHNEPNLLQSKMLHCATPLCQHISKGIAAELGFVSQGVLPGSWLCSAADGRGVLASFRSGSHRPVGFVPQWSGERLWPHFAAGAAGWLALFRSGRARVNGFVSQAGWRRSSREAGARSAMRTWELRKTARPTTEARRARRILLLFLIFSVFSAALWWVFQMSHFASAPSCETGGWEGIVWACSHG